MEETAVSQKRIWLRPELVAQFEFTEWTRDGHLRHSKFVALREDKNAREVVREGSTVSLIPELSAGQ
jgi:ATP-dependent DNA ligase